MTLLGIGDERAESHDELAGIRWLIEFFNREVGGRLPLSLAGGLCGALLGTLGPLEPTSRDDDRPGIDRKADSP
ncbi:MAG: hypothetical protein DWQ01_10845 [Planctomycetota bacterium]|nr:MAG: hypothetical protein DWQ01_10845 [Planctomycetota bacterium]